MPEKPTISFDIPSDVKTAAQSGWVYRSAPADASASVSRTRAASRAAAAPTWSDRATEVLVMPFSLPICLILSLLPPSRRAHPPK